MRKTLRRQDGVAMTEFALVLPIFVLLIAGLLSFGRVFYYWIEANHLANETARWAVVDRNPYGTPLQTHARDASSQEFRNVNVCIDFPKGAATTVGDPLRVRVQKPFSILPLLNAGVMKITIRGTAEMRIERFDSGIYPPTNYKPGPPPSGQDVGTCT